MEQLFYKQFPFFVLNHHKIQHYQQLVHIEITKCKIIYQHFKHTYQQYLLYKFILNYLYNTENIVIFSVCFIKFLYKY